MTTITANNPTQPRDTFQFLWAHVAACIGLVCLAFNMESPSKIQEMRAEYLELRQCLVADVVDGRATRYRCNSPTANQYVSAERVNAVISANYNYLEDNNCRRTSSDAASATSYRCETSDSSATYLSAVKAFELAETRYLPVNAPATKRYAL